MVTYVVDSIFPSYRARASLPKTHFRNVACSYNFHLEKNISSFKIENNGCVSADSKNNGREKPK